MRRTIWAVRSKLWSGFDGPRLGDVFQLGPHRIVCADATDPEALSRLMGQGEVARFILTDEPYNVPIAGNVTKGRHREFAMASGEMSAGEFLAFNEAWMRAALPHLHEGGLLGTFIDWGGHATANAAAIKLGLAPLNLIVWVKTNGGMGSLYRSQHELLPLFKKGSAPHVNKRRARKAWALALKRLDLPWSLGRLAPTPGEASKIIPPSSRPLCLRTGSSISPIAAISSSTLSSVRARPSSPPRR
jgi:hypothetical protein